MKIEIRTIYFVLLTLLAVEIAWWLSRSEPLTEARQRPFATKASSKIKVSPFPQLNPERLARKGQAMVCG
jgi:hypothetical protein